MYYRSFKRLVQYHPENSDEERVEKLSEAKQHFLDITAEVCPLTFVKARLALERIAAGDRLMIRLNSGEPLENLPRSLVELGYSIVSLVAEEGASVHRLTVAKG